MSNQTAQRPKLSIVVVVILFVWVKQNLSPVNFNIRYSDVAMMARASAPIAGKGLLRGVCFSSDSIILGLLVTTTELLGIRP